MKPLLSSSRGFVKELEQAMRKCAPMKSFVLVFKLVYLQEELGLTTQLFSRNFERNKHRKAAARLQAASDANYLLTSMAKLHSISISKEIVGLVLGSKTNKEACSISRTDRFYSA